MGYYGLGPGMRVADKLTPLEEALQKNLAVESGWKKTLDVLEKLVKNVAQNPAEAKFRKIKLSNAKIVEAITSQPAAVEALRLMGWVVQRDADAGNAGAGSPEVEDNIVLVLPPGVALTFPDHVNKVVEASNAMKKREEALRVEKGLSRMIPAGMEGRETRTAEQVRTSGQATLQRLRSHL